MNFLLIVCTFLLNPQHSNSQVANDSISFLLPWSSAVIKSLNPMINLEQSIQLRALKGYLAKQYVNAYVYLPVFTSSTFLLPASGTWCFPHIVCQLLCPSVFMH